MAERARAYPDNAPGGFFVDQSCIDCETCYILAPEVFQDAGGHSRVHRQPRSLAERRRAQMALVACPTASIGGDDRRGTAAAARAFPEAIEGEVAFCGYTSAKSFGAWSYFIERPGGNVVVDSPRAAGPLLERLSARGGVSLMFLSHRDDVADHERFRERFGCQRVMHRADGLRGLERYLEGEAPVPLAEDLLAIPTPGHTQGSACLLYRNTFLFTGDHLWWSPERGMLSASRSFNWYSWEEQLRSLERLLDFDFRVVLPGHGRALRTDSPAAMRRELERALVRLRAS
jgi:glyoxylase-like metal-dependent hydrolase (beta-lactamase superfamily II)/ferredoxin